MIHKPVAREPSCMHDQHQPASACNVCKDGKQLADWAAGWDAWIAANPDSPEARFVADADRAGWQPVVARRDTPSEDR